MVKSEIELPFIVPDLAHKFQMIAKGNLLSRDQMCDVRTDIWTWVKCNPYIL